MFSKIKEWLIGSVIMKKVAQKFAKHAVGALIGLLSSGKVAEIIAQTGLEIDYTKLETYLVIVITGAFGAIWNFLEHRFVKKA